jgi:PAS domain S-box-containing protein
MVLRYGVALLAITLGVVLTYVLDPLHSRVAFLLLLPIIIFATWYGGAGPGIAALVAATGGTCYLIVSPAQEVFVAGRQDVLRLVFFIATSAFVIYITQSRRQLINELLENRSALEAEMQERQQAAKTAEESEARYRTLFEKNPLATCVVDTATLTYLAVNEAAILHYGYSEEEFLSMWLTDIGPEEDIPLLLQRLQDGASAVPGKQGTWRQRKKDGTLIYVEVTSDAMVFKGRPARLLVFDDVSDRVKADHLMQRINERLEEQVRKRTTTLMEKQQQLRSLASQLSRAEHRERKRLATALHDNLAQLLVLSKLKLERMQSMAPEKSWNTMMDVKQLLDEAVNYTRTLTVNLRPPLLADGDDLQAALKWVADKMTHHGMAIHLRNYDEPQPLSEDVLIVTYQSVQELLWNVIKHSGTTEAFVSIQRVGTQAEVTIEDHGAGFDTAAPSSSSGDGGGFGLLNVKERLLSIGGELTLTAMPHHGTRAVIRIPLNGAEPPATSLPGVDAGSERASEGPPVQRRDALRFVRILLVDDHQTMREGLRSLLEEHDDLLVAGEAADGRTALQLLTEIDIDVVVMDVNLPGLDGVEVTRQIKRLSPGIVVIGLSIHDAATMADSMRGAGASAYLSKGVSLDSLVTMIRENKPLLSGT